MYKLKAKVLEMIRTVSQEDMQIDEDKTKRNRDAEKYAFIFCSAIVF